MTMTAIHRLLPSPPAERALVGTYLEHDLRAESASSDRPFVYSNFVMSVDGRIAVPHPERPGLVVPTDIANDRDWRLFQELAAQADIVISSGRYLRDWADGRAQEILRVDDPRFSDLRDWRQAGGLNPLPDIAVISGSLDFPIPDVLTEGGRRVLVFTTEGSDPARVEEIEARAGRVMVVGSDSVNGALLVDRLGELGYRTVYSATGPKVIHLLAAGGVLDRLYLTFAGRALGGAPYSSIVEGPLLDPPLDLRLEALYLDPEGPGHVPQLFACYARG